jgi:hypothetical protein
MATRNHNAAIQKRINDNDLIVNDRVTSLVKFGFPLSEGIILVYALRTDNTVIFG